MSAVQVTNTGSLCSFRNSARTVFRNSSGIPFVLVSVSTTIIYLYKGNSATPTSWAVFGAISPVPTSYSGLSGAVDSSDVLHICWLDDQGKASPLMYATFDLNGTSDPYYPSGSVIIADIGEDPVNTNLHTAIAIDANDVPHIVYNEFQKISGYASYVLMYVNKVGGSWNTPVQVSYVYMVINHNPDICIDLANLPFIHSSGANAATERNKVYIGNLNNATSFTSYELNQVYSELGSSVCVDNQGNHYVARADASDNLSLWRHSYGASWSTWTLETTTNEMASYVSIVPVGTKIYCFFENSSNEIAYDVYDISGDSWEGETVLETTAEPYNSVKAKWGFWVDNDSGGALVSGSILYSNELTSIYNEDIYDGYSIGSYFTGDGESLSEIWLWMKYSDSSPSGTVHIDIYAHTGTPGSGTGTGSVLATSDSINVSDLPTTDNDWVRFKFSGSNRISVNDGTNYVWIAVTDYPSIWGVRIYHRNYNADLQNIIELDGSTWSHYGLYDFTFKVMTLYRESPSELDYAFVDETASPDIWWNTLSLAVSGGTFLLKRYNGTSWDIITGAKTKVYTGGSFQAKPLKVWDGSQWRTQADS